MVSPRGDGLHVFCNTCRHGLETVQLFGSPTETSSEGRRISGIGDQGNAQLSSQLPCAREGPGILASTATCTYARRGILPSIFMESTQCPTKITRPLATPRDGPQRGASVSTL